MKSRMVMQSYFIALFRIPYILRNTNKQINRKKLYLKNNKLQIIDSIFTRNCLCIKNIVE